MPPLFSAVIPLHNKRRFIGDTLRSALGQDHGSFEVVVVDDGSTDGSPDAVRSIGDERIRLIEQENAGPGPARNRGIAEARGEWIAFLDADDLWLPGHLSVLERVIRAFPAAEVAATAFVRRPAGTPAPSADEAGTGSLFLMNYFREAAEREALWTSSTAVRRETCLEAGGFGAFWPGEDVEYWARLALDHEIAASPEVTAVYTIGTEGLMESWTARKNARFELQPVFATLDRALRDERYRDRHADIGRYRKCLLEQGARQALYRGERGIARRTLEEIARGGETPPLALRLLSHLPGPSVALGSRIYSAAKRVLRT